MPSFNNEIYIKDCDKCGKCEYKVNGEKSESVMDFFKTRNFVKSLLSQAENLEKTLEDNIEFIGPGGLQSVWTKLFVLFPDRILKSVCFCFKSVNKIS
jgi:hypothetical protein